MVFQGGHSTRDEMCLAFLEYYPRSIGSVEVCLSMGDPYETLGLLGVELYPDSNIVIDPQGQNLTVKQWVTKNVNWGASDLSHRFQDKVRNADHDVVCMRRKPPTEKPDKPTSGGEVSATFSILYTFMGTWKLFFREIILGS